MDYFRPYEKETLNQYIYRLGNMKDVFKISWSDIVENIEKYYDKNINKDTVRHLYYGMDARDEIEEIDVNTRILAISDSHYPFNVPKEVLKDYVGKADILLINGDESDCQSVSKYNKKYRLPFVDEMIGARQMIIDIINYIQPKRVIFNYGNHNARLIRYFTDRVHDDLLQLMPETNLDFIVDMGFYRHNHQDKSKTFYEPLVKVFEGTGIEIEYTKNWWCKVGKTIFSHPMAYKSGILGTVEKAYLYYLQLGEEFDAICVAHTHQIGLTKYGDTFLFESGCLCQQMEYTSGRLTRPQTLGFVYIVQDADGNLIYDKSKLVCL